jgi:hypothetical protein
MKKGLWFITVFLSGLTLFGQTQLRQVVAASGGSGKNEETVIEWTLGEPVIANLSADSIILTQGFQQPSLVVTAIKTTDGLPYTVEAYPNPTENLLLIELDNTEVRDFQYLLYDINGKVLEQKKLESDITAINMDNYPAGVYLLKVIQLEKEIKTFEIVKH